MRTGNGRHRRPRQAPALVVAAGVTGSAIAIPLLGAAGAHAADATTWDRVALCESGGVWSADLDNGYYGGLQLSQDAWDQYGGGQYASRPDLASRSQQIAVAEKVYAAEGAKPWLSCATISGLTKGDATAPLVDPGAPDTASPAPSDSSSGSTGTPKSSDPATGSHSDSGSGTASPSPSDSASDSGSDSDATDHPSDSASPEPSRSTASVDASDDSSAPSQSEKAGKHRGGRADEPLNGSARPEDSGRHASRSESPERDDAGSEHSYTVRSGDNLWAIAHAHDLPGGWRALYAANHRTVGSDPDLIIPGQTLDLDQNQG
ncbi:transglycosylase family protein [Streptomyces sp. NBC_00344]|uniref:transglycosylase family protein n=1 Tax=Streptomyces sp. NBC_00344 TaxID=2975720 RepID=UPI002E1D3A5E